MMKNAIAWVEIPVNDFERAKKFYAAVLGGELQEVPIGEGMRYAMFPIDPQGGGVGGAIMTVSDGSTSPSNLGSRVYLDGGDDLSPMLSRAEKAGAKVMMPKTAISPEFGFFAMVEDTEGNVIGLHSMK